MKELMLTKQEKNKNLFSYIKMRKEIFTFGNNAS